jgi:hypothetical protein
MLHRLNQIIEKVNKTSPSGISPSTGGGVSEMSPHNVFPPRLSASIKNKLRKLLKKWNPLLDKEQQDEIIKMCEVLFDSRKNVLTQCFNFPVYVEGFKCPITRFLDFCKYLEREWEEEDDWVIWFRCRYFIKYNGM